MDTIKGNLEATVLLNKNTCFYMKSGRCSLDIVGDLSMLPAIKSAQSDLLYCPRLYQAMREKKRERTIKILPCRCGHAEVVSGKQKACIASQKRLQLTVLAEGDECGELCPVCGRQMTFDEEDAMSAGGARIVTVKAAIETK